MSTAYRLWLPRFMLGALLLVGGPAFGQVDLNGHWNSAEFGPVRVFHDDYSVYVLAPHGDQCGRSVYLAGVLEGNQLSGSMWRCTDADLMAKCSHAPIYKIDFTATVSRSSFPFERGQINIESQQLNVAFKMQYWNTSECKEEKVKPLSDFVLRDTWVEPTQTPTPTPTPTDPCGWTEPGSRAWLRCQGWNWGILPSPLPNKAQ